MEIILSYCSIDLGVVQCSPCLYLKYKAGSSQLSEKTENGPFITLQIHKFFPSYASLQIISYPGPQIYSAKIERTESYTHPQCSMGLCCFAKCAPTM